MVNLFSRFNLLISSFIDVSDLLILVIISHKKFVSLCKCLNQTILTPIKSEPYVQKIMVSPIWGKLNY
jgi:hypothetical protein